MAKRPRQRMENQLDWLIQSMTMMSKKIDTMEQRIDKIENILAIDIPHPFTPKSNVIIRQQSRYGSTKKSLPYREIQNWSGIAP